ncbi:MAG: 30S ribosomal protein S20 [Chitinophagales bacterium]
MPNIKSAEKRVRLAEQNRLHNQSVKSSLRTAIKKSEQASSAQDASAVEKFRAASSALDKAAARGVIHPNKAARKKSQLAKKLGAQA